MGFTFFSVSFAWVFFRSEDVCSAIDYLLRMVKEFGIPSTNRSGAFLILQFTFIDWIFRGCDRNIFNFKTTTIRYAMYIIIVFLTSLNFHREVKQFIYFQF